MRRSSERWLCQVTRGQPSELSSEAVSRHDCKYRAMFNWEVAGCQEAKALTG